MITPDLLPHLGPWDLVLIFGVSLQSTLIAVVRHPRWKALLYSFPVPFTIANLALNRAVGVAHMAGLLNLLLFMNLVRWLHVGLRRRIVPSIAGSALLYVALGSALNAILPERPWSFWVAFGLVVAAGLTLLRLLPHRVEPGHRSPLPVPLKFAVVAGVISILVVLKEVLGGFMATFPMVGVVGTYEARRSLWTMSRQAPLVLLALGTMAASMRITQQALAMSIPASLAVGWIFFLGVLWPATVVRWRREEQATRARR